jgi:hypothetical protein
VLLFAERLTLGKSIIRRVFLFAECGTRQRSYSPSARRNALGKNFCTRQRCRLRQRRASVLIEKILRASPGVGKIYVVIKAKDTEAASKRVQNEVVDIELFKCLQDIHAKTTTAL